MKNATRRGLIRVYRVVTIGIALTLSVASLTACGRDVANGLNRLLAMKPPYPDTDTHLMFAVSSIGGFGPIHWIDNDHVLFAGYEIVKSKDSPRWDHLSNSDPGIYILDTKANTFVRYAPLTQHFRMCFNRGYLFYNTAEANDNEPLAFRAGPLGSEQPVVTNERYGHMAEQRRCQGWPGQESPDKHPTELIFPLDPKDGYIRIAYWDDPNKPGINEATQHEKVELIQPSGNVLALPIERKEMEASEASYSAYLDAYVIIPRTPRGAPFNVYAGWPKEELVPIYVLKHDGTVTTVQLPAGLPQISAVYATDAGWVLGSNATTGNSRQAGAWLIKDGKPQKLFEHLVTAMGVSPDGCKLAYAFNSYNPMLVDTVHVMNLCAKASVGAAP